MFVCVYVTVCMGTYTPLSTHVQLSSLSTCNIERSGDEAKVMMCCERVRRCVWIKEKVKEMCIKGRERCVLRELDKSVCLWRREIIM